MFEKNFNIEKDFVQIRNKIRKKVLFFQHNLVTDGSVNEFHLIFCRNVLIYFNKHLQRNVFDTINMSLVNNGFLILGESEVLPKKYNYKEIGNKKNKIYKKEIK